MSVAQGLLARVLASRAEDAAKRDGLQQTLVERGATAVFTPEEEAEYRGVIDAMAGYPARIAELEEQLRSDQAAAAAEQRLGLTPSVRINSEPVTYTERGEHSWFRDIVRAQAKDRNDEAARGRLMKHSQEMEVLTQEAGLEKRTNPNRTDGQGGEFVQVAA